MATPFGSFNASSLGGFIQSPLGARGGGFPNGWYYGNGTTLWRSSDGVTWSSQSFATGFASIGISADYTRLFGRQRYSTQPNLQTDSAYSGVAVSACVMMPIEIAGNFVMMQNSAAATSIIYSTDGGVTWSSATIPDSSDGTTTTKSVNIGQMYKYGNTLYALVRGTVSGTARAYAISSADGITWTGYAQTPVGGSLSGANTCIFYFDGAQWVIIDTDNTSGARYVSSDLNTWTIDNGGSVAMRRALDGARLIKNGSYSLALLPGSYYYSSDSFLNGTLVNTHKELSIDRNGALIGIRTATGYPARSTDLVNWSDLSSDNLSPGTGAKLCRDGMIF